MGKKIRLDSDAFKALSSDTRMDILKKLDSRRMTVTELSESLEISKSTAHEHLSKLSSSELVEKVDNSNKWVYYELTNKGNEILNPKRTSKIVLFVSSILAAGVGSVYEFFRSFKAMTPTETTEMMSTAQDAGARIEEADQATKAAGQIPWMDIVIGIILLVITAYLSYRLWKYLN